LSTHEPSQPEYLGAGSTPPEPDETAPKRARGRRTGLVAGAAVAVVAAVGAGTYGVVQLLSGGSSAATAVPADAVAYVSVDLDPTASQKIEAFKILRKFPAIKKELGSRDDIRKAVFEEIRKDDGCADLDYAKDVEPWIGDRVAVAAVPDSKQGAAPLVVLQVTDQEKAKAGARAIESCGPDASDQEPSRTGITFVGDYMLLAETQREADAFAKDAEAGTLADSEEFTAAMERTGEPGIVSMYVSKDAPRALATAVAQDSAVGSDNGTRDQIDQLEKTFKDFGGAAGVVRFRDGAVEAEFAAQGLPSTMGGGTGAGADTGTLPGTTAAAFSVAFRDGWLEDYLRQMNAMSGSQETLDDMLAEGEQATGLQLPEDIETLLGDGITVSVDSSADIEAFMSSPAPSQLPAGIRIQGDPHKIVPIIDKLKAVAGPAGDLVKVARGDGQVAVGLSQAYVDTLLKKGNLSSVTAFDTVVPKADRATGSLYVNFDAGDGWAEQLADTLSDGDAEARSNIAPLDALGLSGWSDGDVEHGLLRLTTD
jgi:hypothetical protein